LGNGIGDEKKKLIKTVGKAHKNEKVNESYLLELKIGWFF
jgi:hypothetical protein